MLCLLLDEMLVFTTTFQLFEAEILRYEKQKYLSDLSLSNRISAVCILCQKDTLIATKEDGVFPNFQTC